MKISRAATYFLAIFSVSVLTLRADLGTNLTPSADSSLFEPSPDNNLGGYIEIAAGTTAASSKSRGVLKFDLTQLPPNAIITSASLVLTVTKVPFGGGVGSVFGLHRILKDWGEGTNATPNNGGPATTNEVTWTNRFHPSVPWTPAGGGVDVDYVAALSATNFFNAVGSGTFNSTPGLVADLQAWLTNPATNFGWLLISESEATAATARRFASREATTGKPVLTVGYILPPTISQVAVVGNQIHFAFNAESNRTYAVEFRSSAASGVWLTLTNIPTLPAAATVAVTDSLANGIRFYRIRTP